jgi:hypothetical protein
MCNSLSCTNLREYDGLPIISPCASIGQRAAIYLDRYCHHSSIHSSASTTMLHKSAILDFGHVGDEGEVQAPAHDRLEDF